VTATAISVTLRPVPFWTRISYGIGAVAYGIKDNGFSVFLGFYYNQIVGMPPQHVGFILALALVFDAVIDPAIGVLSDRTRTRFGRRHPWLYASALPITISWLLLWYPPQGSEAMILGWLGITAILARAAIATNEVPSLALAPELTQDYHERTMVLRYRFLFGWIGGLGILMAAYGVFLQPPYGALSGPEARPGFQLYGMVGAGIMGISILLSAIGTQRHTLAVQQPAVAPMCMAETRAALGQTLRNRAFVILLAASLFGFIQQGVGFAMSQYLLAFVWQFSATQIVFQTMSLIGAATLAFLICAPVSQRLGKPHAAALFAVCGAAINATPYLLRFADLMPPVGSNALLAAFSAMNAMGTGLGIAAMIIGGSMMSDVVEASQETTGRREEGLFFAGMLFVQKCATGIGILLVFQILGLVGFPQAAVPGRVPVAVIDGMTTYHVAVLFIMSFITAYAFTRFPFGKDAHDARLARLAAARTPVHGEP
jgi:glycoside/pentoside/hexuronide:cation symporter, GPH family